MNLETYRRDLKNLYLLSSEKKEIKFKISKYTKEQNLLVEKEFDKKEIEEILNVNIGNFENWWFPRKWQRIEGKNRPLVCMKKFVGYKKDWVNDFNTKGLKLCYVNEKGEYFSLDFSKDKKEYLHVRNKPTHFYYK